MSICVGSSQSAAEPERAASAGRSDHIVGAVAESDELDENDHNAALMIKMTDRATESTLRDGRIS